MFIISIIMWLEIISLENVFFFFLISDLLAGFYTACVALAVASRSGVVPG